MQDCSRDWVDKRCVCISRNASPSDWFISSRLASYAGPVTRSHRGGGHSTCATWLPYPPKPPLFSAMLAVSVAVSELVVHELCVAVGVLCGGCCVRRAGPCVFLAGRPDTA